MVMTGTYHSLSVHGNLHHSTYYHNNGNKVDNDATVMVSVAGVRSVQIKLSAIDPIHRHLAICNLPLFTGIFTFVDVTTGVQ